MIFKVCYTIDNVDCRWCVFKDKEQAKEEFLRRCDDLGVDNTWNLAKLNKSLEYWNVEKLEVGDILFWIRIGVMVEKINY